MSYAKTNKILKELFNNFGKIQKQRIMDREIKRVRVKVNHKQGIATVHINDCIKKVVLF